MAQGVAAVGRTAHFPREVGENAADVTRGTRQRGMCASQWKVRWRPRMIESAQPVVKRVAHLAGLRKVSLHVIRIGSVLKIGLVTGNTSR